MHNCVTSHLWLKTALHASSHPCMCTCVLRLGCFLFTRLLSSSSSLRSTSSPSRCSSQSSTRGPGPNPSATSAWGPWPLLTTRHPSQNILWTTTKPCLNREFLRVDQRNYHSLKIFVFLHGLMTWLAMQRNVWNDIVSWQTRRLNNSTKYLLHASMTTTTSKKKKQNLLENCQIHALKLF